MDKFVIVNFHTPEYDEYFERQANAAQRLGYRIVNKRIDWSEGWQAMTNMKALFVEDMINELENDTESIVWLDADAMVWKYPCVFDAFAGNCDIAVYRRPGNKELLSGTVQFGTLGPARRIVSRWHELNEQDPKTLEQRHLDQAIKESTEARVEALPPEYCCIKDIGRRDHPGIIPVIEHFQHSRVVRRQEKNKDV